jgi:hypothetical protein
MQRVISDNGTTDVEEIRGRVRLAGSELQGVALATANAADHHPAMPVTVLTGIEQLVAHIQEALACLELHLADLQDVDATAPAGVAG